MANVKTSGKTDSGMVERYNRLWPKTQSPLSIELIAYREKWDKSCGGKGEHQHFVNAFRMLYPRFIWHEWVELQIWAWCNYKVTNTIGHTRASKTFTISHILYLDYMADSLNTWTSLSTVTFSGLKDRMWSDLMGAVSSAAIPCPYKIVSNSNEAKIRWNYDKNLTAEQNREREKFQIDGFATSKTKDSKGRIQGKHAPRRRVILDEAQEMPDAIYDAEKNAQSAPDYKGVRLANPVEKLSRFGFECEPAGGWGSITENDLQWETKNGNICLHLDGFQCHNMKTYFLFQEGKLNKEQYDEALLPFQPKPEYFLSLEEGSLPYWMYGKAFFPSDGLVNRVFTDVHLQNMKDPNVDWDFAPEKLATLDPAYEHDDCILHIGEFGKKRGKDYHINSLETMAIITGKGGDRTPKDYQIARKCIEICETHGIKPENFIMDKTGNGRSVYAIMQMEWSPKIQGVEFGGKPSNRLIRNGDDKTCEELFMYFVDELWFRCAEWARTGQLTGIDNLHENTQVDLGARRYVIQNNKSRLEKKVDMKNRIGRSPDFGDSWILAPELLARKGIHAGTGETKLQVGAGWESARQRAKKVNSIYDDNW